MNLPHERFTSAAVVGAGTMGAGIAFAYARSGMAVLLKDAHQSSLDDGLRRIAELCRTSVERGKMTAAAVTKVEALITPVVDYDRFGEVDIITEAVFENLALKKAVFTELGQVSRADCVIASNTSTIDIDEIATASGRAASVVGLHFFCPAHIMKLIEIVRGTHTSDDTIDRCRALAERLDKTGIVVGNCFGFVANRMLMHYMREAYLLVEEGCTVQQVDGALVRFGMPMGPFTMQDMVGLDVGARIRRDLRSVGKTMVAGPESPLPDQLCERGRYGRKANAGWYRYAQGGSDPKPDPLIEELASAAAARRGIVRRTIDDGEVVGRTIAALINEGANLLATGHASSPRDIDQIYCLGFGFPRNHGGPMRHADSLGLNTVLGRVRSYQAQFGSHWAPSTLLEQLAAEQRGFYLS